MLVTSEDLGPRVAGKAVQGVDCKKKEVLCPMIECVIVNQELFKKR